MSELGTAAIGSQCALLISNLLKGQLEVLIPIRINSNCKLRLGIEPDAIQSQSYPEPFLWSTFGFVMGL